MNWKILFKAILRVPVFICLYVIYYSIAKFTGFDVDEQNNIYILIIAGSIISIILAGILLSKSNKIRMLELNKIHLTFIILAITYSYVIQIKTQII